MTETTTTATTTGHAIERGTPAYWVTYLGDAPIFTPCLVVAVESTPDGPLAVFQTDIVQSAGLVGTAVVARAATYKPRGGERRIVRPSYGVIGA